MSVGEEKVNRKLERRYSETREKSQVTTSPRQFKVKVLEDMLGKKRGGAEEVREREREGWGRTWAFPSSGLASPRD